jgi:hypothetical protein
MCAQRAYQREDLLCRSSHVIATETACLLLQSFKLPDVAGPACHLQPGWRPPGEQHGHITQGGEWR